MRPFVRKRARKQREHEIQRADNVMRIPADDEPLIQMRAMRFKNIFTVEGATNERDARVHDERPHQQRADEKRVAALRCGKKRQHRKRVTEKCAGNVAHKNFCGRPVVTEKTQTACGNDQRQRKNKIVVRVRCERHPAERARQRHAARDTVNAVHEVVRVDESHDPQKRDDDSHRAQMQFAEQRNRDNLEISQAIDRNRRNDSLHCKSDARRKRMEIVAPTENRNDDAAHEIYQRVTQLHGSHRPYG